MKFEIIILVIIFFFFFSRCRGCMELSYCSPECWASSWPSYHKWECPGYQMGIWRQIGIAHLALKVLLISVSTTEIFRFNQVQKLVTNIDKQSDDDLMVYSVVSSSGIHQVSLIIIPLGLESISNFIFFSPVRLP